MKLFVTKLSFLSIILYGILYYIDHAIEIGIQNSGFEDIPAWKDLFEGKINDELVILGSSRAYNHFDPKQIEENTGISTYNLAFTGTLYRQQKMKLLAYMNYNPKPKILAWVLDLHTFTKTEDFYGYEKLMAFTKYSEVQVALESYNLYPTYYQILPLSKYGNRPKLKWMGLNNYFLGAKQTVSVYKGYSGRDLKWDGTELRRQKGRNINGIFTKPLNSELVDFENLIGELIESDIKVILIFAPIYVNALNFENNSEEIISRYGKMSEKLNVSFLDYSKLELNNDTINFHNGNHLNLIGVEKFMKFFCHDLLQ